MSSLPAPTVTTLGCRLNLAESERIRGLLAGRDTVVVNTCAVTNAAVRDSRAAVRRAARAHPGRRLAVTGCAARIDPAGFLAMPGVDRVVANEAKLDPAAWTDNRDGAPRPAPIAAFAGHARGFVGVQTGCDHACTFCAIPAGRGASRSAAIPAAVAEVAALAAAGHREVVLTGVDLTSFTPSLGVLIEAILTQVPALERLRLSSLDAIEIDDRLFALVTQEPRVAPHLHLSLQHGDDLILKRMRRRHTRGQAAALVERLKRARPELTIGADLIAGFPTESDAAFARTLALLDDCDVVHAHVFPYSPRAGTPAARMPQLAPSLGRERAQRLRMRAAERKAAWLTGLVGSIQHVVAERPGDRGHAGNFAEVRLDRTIAVGEMAAVRITGSDGTHLHGQPL